MNRPTGPQRARLDHMVNLVERRNAITRAEAHLDHAMLEANDSGITIQDIAVQLGTTTMYVRKSIKRARG